MTKLLLFTYYLTWFTVTPSSLRVVVLFAEGWVTPTVTPTTSSNNPPPHRFTTITTTALGVASSTTTTTTSSMPRLTEDHLKELENQKYIVIPNFISSQQVDALRQDILELRNVHHKFNVAKIGQDATNTLNTQIRVAETCFIGPTKTIQDLPLTNPASAQARSDLYNILDQVRVDLCHSSSSSSQKTRRRRTLDPGLTELLYAYYPKGGYYRRHTDAVPNSASVLRSISLLLYLNEADWNMSQKTNDGGQLRIHLNDSSSGKNDEEDYVDVEPRGGTLVLFESDAIPHEVLDTSRERMAVVGWYNRPLALTDIADLAQGSTGSGGEFQKTIMLGVAAALVTVGVVQLVS